MYFNPHFVNKGGGRSADVDKREGGGGHSVFLDQSILTQRLGPVYLDPSIWICLFGPVYLDLASLTQIF